MVQSVQPRDRAGQDAHALGLDAVLEALLEQDLHADAHAEDRPLLAQPVPHDGAATDGVQPGHAGREGSHPGYDEPVGRCGQLPKAGQLVLAERLGRE